MGRKLGQQVGAESGSSPRLAVLTVQVGGCEGHLPAITFSLSCRGSRHTSNTNLAAQGLAPVCLLGLLSGSPEAEEISPGSGVLTFQSV